MARMKKSTLQGLFISKPLPHFTSLLSSRKFHQTPRIDVFACGRVCMRVLWLAQIIPDHAQYRKDVEAISHYRLKVATETEDVRKKPA